MLNLEPFHLPNCLFPDWFSYLKTIGFSGGSVPRVKPDWSKPVMVIPFPASDWFRKGHVTLFWPRRDERKSGGWGALREVFLHSWAGSWQRHCSPSLSVGGEAVMCGAPAATLQPWGTSLRTKTRWQGRKICPQWCHPGSESASPGAPASFLGFWLVK